MDSFKNGYFNDLIPKIAKDLSSAGFSSITDLLNKHRFKSYTFISDFISNSFPMVIIYMQFVEAKREKRVVQALKDCLSRYLVEKLPNGWGIGGDAKWQSIRALTNWETVVETAGELPELSEILARISHDLIQDPPPHGWSPEIHGFDKIDSIFEKHLNESAINGTIKQPTSLQ